MNSTAMNSSTAISFISKYVDKILSEAYRNYSSEATDTEGSGWIYACIFSVLLSLGIIGNIAVIIGIIAFLGVRTNATHVFVLNLAIADLCFIIVLPLAINLFVEKNWAGGSLTCTFYYSGTGVNQYCSMLLLTALSIDRYIAVCRVNTSLAAKRTPTKAALACLACWIVTIVICIPVIQYATVKEKHDAWFERAKREVVVWKIWNFQEDAKNVSGPFAGFLIPNKWLDRIRVYTCDLDFESSYNMVNRLTFTVYTFIVAFAIPMAVMWTLYGLIVWKLQHRPLAGVAAAARGRQQMSRRSTRISIALVTFYTVCWVPYWTAQLTIMFSPPRSIDRKLISILSHTAHILQVVNSAFNPYLFLLVSRQVRSRLKAGVEICILRNRNAMLARNIGGTPENTFFRRAQSMYGSTSSMRMNGVNRSVSPCPASATSRMYSSIIYKNNGSQPEYSNTVESRTLVPVIQIDSPIHTDIETCI